MAGEKILMVDDEPDIVGLAKIKLEKEGFKVLSAYNGEEGLRTAAKEAPDLIILDIMMPKMDGWQVQKKLQENPVTKEIPVIILTAVGQFEKQIEGLETEIADYITKPFSPQDLTGKVTKALDKTERQKLTREKHRKEVKLKTLMDIVHKKE